MASPESQRTIDLVHRLTEPGSSIEETLRRPLRPQGLEVKGRVRALVVDHQAAVDKIARRKPLTQAEVIYVQSILLPDLRPAIEIVDDDYGPVLHPQWSILNDAAVRDRLGAVIRATCRIENDGAEIGTGFLVGPGLIMTNRHVASAFVAGVGLAPRFVWFSPSADRPRVNFRRESARPDIEESVTYAIAGPVMMHPYFDIALLRTDRAVAGVTPLTLAADPNAAQPSASIALVGYPAHDANDEELPESVITAPFGVKRLQPGKLGLAANVRSYDKSVMSCGHDSSTLGGSSGSPVADLSTGDIVAVHFYGRLRNSNWAVPASKLACDPRIAAAGVAFDAAGASSSGPWDEWWDLADANAIAAGDFQGTESVRGRRTTVTVTVPLTIRLNLTTGSVSASGGTPRPPKPAKDRKRRPAGKPR